MKISQPIVTPLLTLLMVAGLDAAEPETVLPIDGVERDFFGKSLDLNGDTLIVGSYYKLIEGQVGAGQVYVYEVDTTENWSETAVFRDLQPEAYDRFGHALEMGDGLLAIGSYQDDNAHEDAGAVYLFNEDPVEQWSTGETLFAPDPAAGEQAYFGYSVAVDGTRVAVGAPGVASRRGAVYVFDYDGSDWQPATLPVSRDLLAHDFLGHGVELRGDWLFASAPQAGGNGEGAVFVYQWFEGAWVERQVLSPPAGWGLPLQGYGSEVCAGQGYLAVACESADVPGKKNVGAVFIYEWADATREWVLSTTLVGSHAEGHMGSSLDFSGLNLAVGAFGARDPAGQRTGLAYLYAPRGGAGEWERLHAFQPVTAKAGDRFAYDLAVDGSRLAVGIYGFDQLGALSGAVQVYGLQRFGVGIDSDGDGLVDDWEIEHFASLDSSAEDDPDGDGLSNAFEQLAGLKPNERDSDGDGTPDDQEDPDADNLVNAQEALLRTDPLDRDTDADGLFDGNDAAPLKQSHPVPALSVFTPLEK